MLNLTLLPMLPPHPLQAYFIPNWSFTSTFKRDFWLGELPFQIPGSASATTPTWLVLVYCASWTLAVHAAIHITTSIARLGLSRCPSAERNGNVITVGQHRNRVVKFEASAALILWLAGLLLLVDGLGGVYLSKILEKSVAFLNPDKGVLPYWALVVLIYIGVLVLVKACVLVMHRLPRRLRRILLLVPNASAWDDSMNADLLYAHKNLRTSQGTWRYIVNFLMWACIITAKFLFDFFVVVQPIGGGPAAHMIQRVAKGESTYFTAATWSDILTVVIVCFGLFFSTGLLTLYNTGLFYQMFSSIYSVLFLAVPRSVGIVR
jgi:hypothetical protein